MTGLRLTALACAISLALGGQISVAQSAVTSTDAIEAQPLSSALNTFARNTGLQIIYVSNVAQGMQSPGARQGLNAEETLRELLRGTNLTYEFLNERTVQIRGGGAETRALLNWNETANWAEQAASRPASTHAVHQIAGEEEKLSTGDGKELAGSTVEMETKRPTALPEILVEGSSSLNTDIQRTRDDVQPYVVFSAEEIVQSNSFNLDEFLKVRLPMNTQNSTSLQDPGSPSTGHVGRINLRGLGTSQTLVLVDGRRIASVSSTDALEQPSITGIPLSAIERIEVLPSTASGIYGGGATGGVVNIILKRDYSGLDLQVGYGDTFDTAVSRLDVSGTAGFIFGEGRTQLMISASHSRQGRLTDAERRFSRKSAELLIENDPTSADIPFQFGDTTNVISVTGENLVLDDGTALDAPNTFVPYGYAGPMGLPGFPSDNGAALVSNAGQTNINDESLLLLHAPDTNSVSLSVRQEIGTRLEGFLSLYGDRVVNSQANPLFLDIVIPADSPDNPFLQDILTRQPLPSTSGVTRGESELESLRANAGFIIKLPNEWTGSLDYGWSRTRSSSINEFQDLPTESGMIELSAAALRDLGAFPISNTRTAFRIVTNKYGPAETDLSDVAFRLSGPLFESAGGPIALTGLAEQRKENVGDIFNETQFPGVGSDIRWLPPAEQTVESLYWEVRAPLFSNLNSRKFLHDLEVLTSVRHDEYETRTISQPVSIPARDGPFPEVNYFTNNLESTDYVVGFRYAPFRDLAIRSSYGTGFLPPRLTHLAPNEFTDQAIFFSHLSDPQRGGTPLIGDSSGLLTLIVNGNPNIAPEQSESTSIGIVLTPRFLPGLHLSVDYTQIEKSDEIFAPPEQFIIDNEASYPGRIVRGERLAGDPEGWAGPITSMDVTYINLVTTDVRAYDLQIDYSFNTQNWGNWRFNLIGTQQKTFAQQALPDSEEVDSVGSVDGPLEWRGNFGVDWESGRWAIGWNAQYFDSYNVCPSTTLPDNCEMFFVRSQGSDRIESQLYHDIFAQYRFGEDSTGSWRSALSDFEVTMGIQNVFDTRPPIIVNGGPYSQYGDPRMRRFQLTFRMHF